MPKIQEVYIRGFTKATIIEKKEIKLKDIAVVSSQSPLKQQIEEICVATLQADKKTNYLITINDVIDLITTQFEEVTVNNVGEMDMIIEYFPVRPKKNILIEWIKVAIACLIIFAGSTVAIMAYHTDTSLGKAFTILNRIFTGKSEENPLFLTIPYSIGLPIGSLFFFNHIGKKKLTEDPTPIQVEMNKYEKDVENTIVEILSDEKRS